MTVLPAESLGSKQNYMTGSVGIHLSCETLSTGSKRSRIVSAEAKYDGQSRPEAKLIETWRTIVYPLIYHWRK